MAGYRGGAGEDFGWSVEGNDRFAEWKGERILVGAWKVMTGLQSG